MMPMLTIFILSIAIFTALPATAYIGPGAAIGLMGWAFGLAGVVAGCVFFVLLYPAIKFYRWYKAKKAASNTKHT